jgi:hypothetical protein
LDLVSRRLAGSGRQPRDFQLLCPWRLIVAENEDRRTSKPTDKMLDFAKAIAKSLGRRVPDEVMADFDACRDFIDTNKEAASRPSEKQTDYAKAIAKRKGVTVPQEALADRRLISAWIDENKD